MGNFKIGNVMPTAIGKIKAGSSNVQRIYNGAEQVWPPVLPSILTSGPGATNACQATQNTSIYFEIVPPATNTFPVVNDSVFTDPNGTTPLNNTSTIYYYISSTTALGVQNGVVVSSGQCTGTPTYNYYIAKGCPGGTYNGFDRKVKSTASLNYNGTSTGGDSFSEFGSCWYIDGASTETAYNANLNCGCGAGNTCSSADCSSLDVSNVSITSGCAACTGGGGSNLRISDCQTGVDWTAANTYGHSLNDVVQYRIGVPGTGAVYCGTVQDINSVAAADASTIGAQTYGCGDSVHCQT